MAGIVEQGQRANIEEASQEFKTRLLNVLGNPEQAELSWINSTSGQELGHLEISEGAITSASYGDLSLANGNGIAIKSVADLVALPLKMLRVQRADSLRVRIGSSFEPTATLTTTQTELTANIGVGEGPAANIDRILVHGQVFRDGDSDLCVTDKVETGGDKALPKAFDVIKRILPGAFVSEVTESTPSDQ